MAGLTPKVDLKLTAVLRQKVGSIVMAGSTPTVEL